MKNKKLHIWIALVVIAFFVCLAIFGCGDSIKGIRDMRFGIDIRGCVEAVFEPAGLKTKPTKEQLEMARDVIETRLDAQTAGRPALPRQAHRGDEHAGTQPRKGCGAGQRVAV